MTRQSTGETRLSHGNSVDKVTLESFLTHDQLWSNCAYTNQPAGKKYIENMEALESVEIMLTRSQINEAVDALHHIGNLVPTYES